MYIFLLHLKYKKVIIKNNCSGFEPFPIKLDNQPLSHFTCVTMLEQMM